MISSDMLTLFENAGICTHPSEEWFREYSSAGAF